MAADAIAIAVNSTAISLFIFGLLQVGLYAADQATLMPFSPGYHTHRPFDSVPPLFDLIKMAPCAEVKRTAGNCRRRQETLVELILRHQLECPPSTDYRDLAVFAEEVDAPLSENG